MSEGVSTKYMALLAAAPAISDNCLAQNRAFVKCKQKDDNPAACLSEGEKVTACALKVLRRCEDKCGEPFVKYQKCLERTNRQFENCRDEQAAFELCFVGKDEEES